jgi:hypothetical protein
MTPENRTGNNRVIGLASIFDNPPGGLTAEGETGPGGDLRLVRHAYIEWIISAAAEGGSQQRADFVQIGGRRPA